VAEPSSTVEITEQPSRSPAPSPSPSPSPTPDPPPAATTEHASAEALAADLLAGEAAIRDPETPADHLPGWAHVQQAAYRQLALTPEWHEAVAAEVPAALRDAYGANLRATIELFALTEPRDELPPWAIVTPPPPDELRSHYLAAGEEFGVNWTYLAAIHLVETRMGRIRGDSVAGARGPMQFLPSTWEAYGEGDITDPRDAIRAAARYLVAHGAPADMPGALWAYNHSDRYVAAIEAYAAVMQAEPVTYEAYYHWQVYYRLRSGDTILEEGWDNTSVTVSVAGRS
jgi:soluble lytic murein transglycosylase-like protein